MKENNNGSLQQTEIKPPTIERDNRRVAIVAFTDLDGTANDETVEEAHRLKTIEPAKKAISILESSGIPVGIITGRSFGEAIFYQNALGNHGPIICEDGAVVVLPPRFDEHQHLSLANFIDTNKIVKHRQRISFVLSQINTSNILELLQEAQKERAHSSTSQTKPILSTLTSSAEEIREAIGHSTTLEARLSGDRLASAYIVQASEDQLGTIKKLSDRFGIRTFGSPLHLIGKDADKGLALKMLNEHSNIFFTSEVKPVNGIAPIIFGNNSNDLRLAEEVEKLRGLFVIVGRPGGGFFVSEKDIPPSAIKATKPFGEGMLEAIPQIRNFFKNSFGVAI